MDDSAPLYSEFLAQYVPLVDFLGRSMGPSVEVVLHDLDVPDQSIVAIANGHISGRKIGGPVTDFALWFMKQADETSVPMMTGYRAVNSEGRVCRSSSYFLRDENNTLHGMLCINVDISELIQLKSLTSKILDSTNISMPGKAETFGGYPGPLVEVAPLEDSLPSSAENLLSTDTGVMSSLSRDATAQQKNDEEEVVVVVESLRSNIQHLLESMLNKTISQYGISPERMQREERLETIRELEKAGFFLLKGGIAAAAKRLDVSEPTIYRYLVEVRE
ncbi:helix-turn-helix transcriptional regulator [uncultured Rothia sp.]|uniref:helix-turn-helix transcriptional regulator n=1 Tax=uncultured Rothia sp. TaxID=316088 RepID=UPI0032175D01